VVRPSVLVCTYDCLSKLLESDKLREEQLQAILAVLLGYVKVTKNRQCCLKQHMVRQCGLSLTAA
jgi:hypothetical protein